MADTIPGDTSSTTTLSVNTSASSAIDFVGDKDWWKVTLTAGFGYQIWVEGSQYGYGTLVNPYLAVNSSAGVFITSNNDRSVLTYDSYLSFFPSARPKCPRPQDGIRISPGGMFSERMMGKAHSIGYSARLFHPPADMKKLSLFLLPLLSAVSSAPAQSLPIVFVTQVPPAARTRSW